MNNKEKGYRYEDIAISYLIRKGHKIIRRNYHSRHGEIDIISLDGDTLVFTKCKFRSSDNFGSPLEAVTITKQRRICHTAMCFYAASPYNEDKNCRFDVIAVHSDGTVEHIENAFQYRG